MNTIKFEINIEAQDSYIYAGHLFFVDKNNVLSYIPLHWLVGHFKNLSNQEFAKFISLVFHRNDFLYNNQANYYFGFPKFKDLFRKTWRNLSHQRSIILEVDPRLITKVSTLPEYPVYDLKVYAMKVFVGTKAGLFESSIITDGDRKIKQLTNFNKRFDSRVINLQAKSGTIFASTGNDGLFYGDFLNEDKLIIEDKNNLGKKSIRSSWSNYDIINYPDNTHFDFYKNDIEKRTLTELKYSKSDEKQEKIHFSNIGAQEISMDTLLRKSPVHKEDILYSFNSANVGFFFLKNGKFVTNNIQKTEDSINFSSRKKELPIKKNSNSLKPLSSHLISKGCVIEFFDSIQLFKNNKVVEIEKEGCTSLRTYQGSIRYKNLISVIKDKTISLHSIYPFEVEKISNSFESFLTPEELLDEEMPF